MSISDFIKGKTYFFLKEEKLQILYLKKKSCQKKELELPFFPNCLLWIDSINVCFTPFCQNWLNDSPKFPSLIAIKQIEHKQLK